MKDYKKGLFIMRHIVEVKMPKIFGKKKVKDETEVRTHVDLDEVSTTIDIPKPLFVGSLVLAGITVGYLAGYRQGVEKGGKFIVVR